MSRVKGEVECKAKSRIKERATTGMGIELSRLVDGLADRSSGLALVPRDRLPINEGCLLCLPLSF